MLLSGDLGDHGTSRYRGLHTNSMALPESQPPPRPSPPVTSVPPWARVTRCHYAPSPARHRFHSRPALDSQAHVEYDRAVGQAAHGVEIHLHELRDSAQ